MAELKPCPFCGSVRIQFLIEGLFQPWDDEGMRLWYHCACHECGAEMDCGCALDMRKAAEAWNRRTAAPGRIDFDFSAED